MRKLLMILTVLFLASCTAQKKQPVAETADLGAVIISDLHYSESDSVNTIVPLASHMKSTMETLVSGV